MSKCNLPENFLNEEVRCEYFVSSEMKRVWAIQLDMLKALHNTLNEHGLHYYAAFGTLLGAIRHKGYIPWDDDLDVLMPRDDYEKLILHPEWFQSPVELHISNSKEHYYEAWARIHNNETAVLYPNYQRDGSNQGIYIDIFPLDDYSDCFAYRLRQKLIYVVNALGHSYSYNCNTNPLLTLFGRISNSVKIFSPEKATALVNKLASKKYNDCSYLSPNVLFAYKREKMVFDKKWFTNNKEMPFEFLNINVPSEYEEVLKTTYGNYMEYPPMEKRGLWHSFTFDTKDSYKKYLKV